jgi:hypothetical protein
VGAAINAVAFAKGLITGRTNTDLVPAANQPAPKQRRFHALFENISD